MTLLAAPMTFAFNRQPTYLCEIGLQAGCGYYAGDATRHIFNNPREAYGIHFRYKFDPRWSIQVKGMGQRITGPEFDDNGTQLNSYWENQLINIDVMGEFNFFRLGPKSYDKRVKRLSPYIFLGFGASIYGDNFSNYGFYIPVGFGLKWKFSQHVGLNLAWQHNIYFADNLENRANLCNTYNLNGANIMNNDVTSQLTLGIVFEFLQPKKICKTCSN